MSARRATTALAVGALCAATALGCREATPSSGRPLVGVSVPPQAFFVEKLAGDLVDVVVLLPPGASHATYEPSMAQIRDLSKASLYVAVRHPGFSFEAAWLEPLLAETPRLVVVGGVPEGERPGSDPHVWLSPRRVRASAEHIHAALLALLPAQRTLLDARLAAFLTEIDALDAELRARLAPLRGRRFLVFHPAWGTFAEDYGLVQLAIEEEGKEPDAKALADRIAAARQEGMQVVFVQPQFSRRSAELVAEEIGARVESLDPMARDWTANLRRVADALVEALGP